MSTHFNARRIFDLKNKSCDKKQQLNEENTG